MKIRKITVLSISILFIPFSIYGQVVGGGITASTEYPWMTDLLDNFGPTCGASLIAPEWVLTAGHCVGGPSPITKVRINGYVRSNPLAQSEVINVDQIYVYPGFASSASYSPDIALIKLTSPSSITPVDIISLAIDTLLTEEGDTSTVLGWGLVDTLFNGSDTLKKADIVFISRSYCNTHYANAVTYDPDTTLCAGYLSGNPPAGSAAGDSGGPLFVKKNGNPLLVGIVSGGGGPITTATEPGIFTKIFPLKNWIQSTMNATSVNELVKENVNVFYSNRIVTIDLTMKIKKKAHFIIYNMQGAEIQSEDILLEMGRNDIPINVELSSGIYIISLSNTEFRTVNKVSIHD